MKTNLFATIFYMLILSTSGLAQFGIQAGAAASKLKIKYEGDVAYEPDSRIGFTAGIAYRMAIGSTFSFQPELNWLQKGMKDKEDGDETTIILNYLEVPVYFLFTGTKPSGFYGGIGPSFNFGISGKEKYKYEGGSEEEDIEFGDEIKGFHMAINVQAGYKCGNGLALNAFVAQSITNSTENEFDDFAKLNLFTYGLRVGYFIAGKKQANNRSIKQLH